MLEWYTAKEVEISNCRILITDKITSLMSRAYIFLFFLLGNLNLLLLLSCDQGKTQKFLYQLFTAVRHVDKKRMRVKAVCSPSNYSYAYWFRISWCGLWNPGIGFKIQPHAHWISVSKKSVSGLRIPDYRPGGELITKCVCIL